MHIYTQNIPNLYRLALKLEKILQKIYGCILLKFNIRSKQEQHLLRHRTKTLKESINRSAYGPTLHDNMVTTQDWHIYCYKYLR